MNKESLLVGQHYPPFGSIQLLPSPRTGRGLEVASTQPRVASPGIPAKLDTTGGLPK